MTVKQANILVKRQVVRSAERLLKLSERSKVRVNPRMLKEIISTSTNFGTINKIKYELIRRVVVNKDEGALKQIMFFSIEKNNSNGVSRRLFIKALAESPIFSKPLTLEQVKVFAECLKDSSANNRLTVMWALARQAQNKNRRVVSALIFGATDENEKIRRYVLEGLISIADLGSGAALPGFIKMLKDPIPSLSTTAYQGICTLAARGNKKAKLFLKKFRGEQK